MNWTEETEIGTRRKIPKIKLKVVWGVARSPEAQDVMTRSTSQIERFVLYISYLPLLLPLEETWLKALSQNNYALESFGSGARCFGQADIMMMNI